jgi:hypothetical protein
VVSFGFYHQNFSSYGHCNDIRMRGNWFDVSVPGLTTSVQSKLSTIPLLQRSS